MQQLVIVTGLSGAGKTVVLRTLEDMEFYCVDNMPISLLPQLIGHIKEDPGFYPQVAVGIDIRNKDHNLAELQSVLSSVNQDVLMTKVIFLSADEATVLKRFSETRRRHPLSNDRSDCTLAEAIQQEYELMLPIKQMSDLLIDTGHLTAQQLKQQIWQIMSQPNDHVSVIIKSFAFKRGVPFDADFVFDARCLPNPYWQPELRSLTGQDQPVREYLEAEDLVQDYVQDLCYFAKKWIGHFEANDRSYITIAIGCTGGQHRSVYMAETLHQFLEKKQVKNMIQHREFKDS